MSRAHMLYDNKALETLPVKITNWSDIWNESNIFRNTSGDGLIIELNICSRSRHLIIDKVNSKHRYVALFVEVLKAARRRFDVNGKEIEPDFGSEKKVNTGYLSSSYKKVSREGEDLLKPDEVIRLLKVPPLDNIITEKMLSLNKRNVVCIWSDEQKIRDIELFDGDHVRLRTKGNGPFLESLTRLNVENQTKKSFTANEPIGESWTDKIMNNKDKKSGDHHLTEDSKAVEDDEWDD